MPQRHRPELVESIAGEPLVTYRRPPRTFRRDRVCAAPECTTHLSIYNSGLYCSAHGPFGLWSLPSSSHAPGDLIDGDPALSRERLVS